MDGNELSWRERGRLWLRIGLRLVGLILALLVLRFAAPPVLSLLMPFVLALVAAWLLNPLVRLIQKKLNIPRGPISLILIILIFALVGGALFGFGYTIVAEVRQLAGSWETIWTDFQQVLSSVSAFFSDFFKMLPDDLEVQALDLLAQAEEWLYTVIPTILAGAASSAGSFAMNLPGWGLGVIFFIMGWYFITADYPRLRHLCTTRIPDGLRRNLSHLKDTALGAFGGYVRAQLILSAGVFAILLVGFLIIGQGYALLLALLFSVMDFIPIIGSGTIIVPWAVYNVLVGDFRHAIELMVVWGFILIFRRVAEPKVVGDQTGLSPILSLISIFVGMKLAGVAGMILGPVLCMVVISVVRGGMLSGVAADLRMAGRDISAILRNRPKDPEAEEKPDDTSQ